MRFTFALAILLLSQPTSYSQILNPENGAGISIAYNVHIRDSVNKNNYEIITMNIDGTNKTNITNNPDVAWTYYAYKNRLFFISDRDTCSRCFFL